MAQLAAHMVHSHDVTGSIPVFETSKIKDDWPKEPHKVNCFWYWVNGYFLRVNRFGVEVFLLKQELFCRHRDVSKSMKKVEAVSRLAEGEPHGCNAGGI